MNVDIQILDCDHVMVDGKPVVRLFGKTIDGETICVFMKGPLPYFYLHAKDIDAVKEELEKAGL